MSFKIIGLLLVATASLVEAVGQLAFKRGATRSSGSGALAGLHAVMQSPGWIGLGILCFIIEWALVTVALQLIDLSVAYPAGSLTLVAVVMLSRLWLGEAVGRRRWAGVMLIVTGTLLLGG